MQNGECKVKLIILQPPVVIYNTIVVSTGQIAMERQEGVGADLMPAPQEEFKQPRTDPLEAIRGRKYAFYAALKSHKDSSLAVVRVEGWERPDLTPYRNVERFRFHAANLSDSIGGRVGLLNTGEGRRTIFP